MKSYNENELIYEYIDDRDKLMLFLFFKSLLNNI